jgi:agarase
MSIARTVSPHNRPRSGGARAPASWPRFLIALGLVFVALAPVAGAQAAGGRPARSGAADQRSGGQSTPFPASGYFTTVQEKNGRWIFVTPTGEPFFSTGVDHVDSDPDTDRTTGQCPYCEAIQSQYSSTAAWETATVAQLRSWGFNSLGPFSNESEFASQMPYSVQLGMASGDDWFAPSFVTNADQVAATQVAPLADDPNLIGWYTDSELSWGGNSDNVNSELDQYLALPAGSPGLAVAEQYVGHPGAFLYALATRYFQVTTAAIRMYDTHHLILGVKAEGQYVPPQLLEAAGHYINVFSLDDYDLQPGFANLIHLLWPYYLPVESNFANFEKYAQIPIMVAEYSFDGETPQTPDTVPGTLATFPTQTARARAYTQYITALYEHAPWVVGDEWFEYVDEPAGGRFDGENNDFGLVDVENQPYGELVTQMEIVHSMAPDRRGQSGSTCDSWAQGQNGVVCTATMPLVTYPLEILGTPLANGVQDQNYRDEVIAEGGQPRYTYRIEQGSLPRGLRLHRGTGAITGHVLSSGTYTVTIEASDSTKPTPMTATQTFSLDVAARS